MKKQILCLLVILLLLSGCRADSSYTSTTGKYGSQTITMTYQVTNIPYPHDMRSIPVVNGFARIYITDEDKAHNDSHSDTWNVIDLKGNLLFDKYYLDISNFNAEGTAIAKNYDGTFVRVSTDGAETSITEQDYQNLIDSYNDIPEKYATAYPDKSVGKGSTVWNGLNLYLEKTKGSDSGKFLVGLADAEGNVIIPAYIPINYSYYTEHLHLNEDVSIVEDITTGNIAIITIIRS